MRLAAQDEAGVELAFLQREVAVHAHAAFDELGAAGGTHARLARVGHVHAGARRGGEDAFVLRREGHFARQPVAQHADDGRGGVADLRRVRDGLRLRWRHAEALDVDAFGRNARRQQSRFGLVVQCMRAADEGLIDAAAQAQESRQLGTIDAPAAQGRIDLLARQHVVQRQAREVAVLQVFELFLEHRRRRRAVAVDQCEARRRITFERRLEDGQDGRDAAATGNAQPVPRSCLICRGLALQRRAEAPLRWHRLDDVPSAQMFMQPA